MGGEAWCPAQLCKCPCPCGGGTQKAPRLPCRPSLPAFPPVALGRACINQEHLQVPSGCYGNSGWSRLGNGGQPPLSSVVSVWIQGSRHTRYLVLQGSSILITLTVRFCCGLRLNAASLMPLLFFYLLFPHCHLFAPSIRGTWLLLGEANPTRFAIFSALWLDKQREGTAHLVTGPRRCQGRTPGWKRPLAGDVFVSCVYTQDRWGSVVKSTREGSAEHTRWCCLSSCSPPSPSFQAPPTCHNSHLRANVDQVLSMAWCCAQGAAFPRVNPLTPHNGSLYYL